MDPYLPRVKAPEGPRTANGGPGRQQITRNKKNRYYVFKNVDSPDLREIVQSVANGLDAALIAPELYPKLIPLFIAQHRNLQNTNPSAAQSLLKAIQFIYKYKPEEEPVAQSEPREDIFLPSQEMIDEGVNLALEGKDLSVIEPQLLQFLIPPLREIRLTSLRKEDYIMAQKAELGSKAVVAQQALQVKLDEQEEKMCDSQQRLEIAQIQLDNVNEKWQILIAQRKQEMENDLMTKQNEFSMKLEIFDKQFEQEPPPKVLKLSPGALDLKAKERFLVSSKRYDEAKKMRTMINLRERQEIQLRKEQYYKTLMKEREKLINQEKQKMFVTEMNWQSNISKMQISANKEIAHAKKTVNHLISMQKSLELECDLTKSSKKLPPLSLSDNHLGSRLNTVR